MTWGCDKADQEMNSEGCAERVVAVIPARGGSKGIPGKNIRLVCGHPLVHYVVQASLKARKVGHTVVSTDDEEIAGIAASCGAEVVRRPAELSTDTSRSEEAVLHALDELQGRGRSFDVVLLLQPTSPLTRPETIDALLGRIEEGFDSACCVSEVKMFLMDDEELLERPMRQAHRSRIRETGNGWATRVATFRETANRICGRLGTVRVSSFEATEIDSPEDLLVVEALLRRRVRREEDRYFARRQAPRADFEKGYWGKVVDPDGVERDLTTEVEDKVADLKVELEHLNSLPGGRICDVGCGLGSMLLGLDGSKWEKRGVEVSGVAAQRASEFGKVFHGELAGAGYPDGHFDAVVCHHVIEHVPDPYGLISEINRVLKIHGRIFISTPDFDSGCARLFGDSYRLLHDKTHVNLFSLASLRRFVDDHGFEIEKEEFPFFKTKYFTEENLLRLLDATKVSPPFYGNYVTLFCVKK